MKDKYLFGGNEKKKFFNVEMSKNFLALLRKADLEVKCVMPYRGS